MDAFHTTHWKSNSAIQCKFVVLKRIWEQWSTKSTRNTIKNKPNDFQAFRYDNIFYNYKTQAQPIKIRNSTVLLNFGPIQRQVPHPIYWTNFKKFLCNGPYKVTHVFFTFNLFDRHNWCSHDTIPTLHASQQSQSTRECHRLPHGWIRVLR